jgi:hypothetical protein
MGLTLRRTARSTNRLKGVCVFILSGYSLPSDPRVAAALLLYRQSHIRRRDLGRALNHRNLVLNRLPATTSATSFIVHFILRAYATPQLCMLSPAIFKWRQTESGLIVCAVRWYLRYSLFVDATYYSDVKMELVTPGLLLLSS